MPDIQNVGALDYVQYQPSQIPQEAAYNEGFNTQPELYDENYLQMQNANKSRLGATILSTLIVAGIGVGSYFLGKRSGKAASKIAEKVSDVAGKATDSSQKELDNVKKQLSDLQNSEAVKNYDKLKKSAQEFEKIADKNAGCFFGSNRIGRNLYNKMKELFKPFLENKE